MASPFTLQRPAGGTKPQTVADEAAGGGSVPVYEIWSRRLGKKVGEVGTREGATRSVDRRDNDYGSADHYWKKVGG
jgi:hypothetical protein